MMQRIINKLKWLLFEQPSFARIQLNQIIPLALRNLPEGLTLEIGAGRSQTLRKHLRNDKMYFSLNLLESLDPDIVADAVNMPFADSSVENIILVEVLEHISVPERLLKECFRVLKPGGTIVGSTRFILYEHAAPYDYHRFTADAINHDFIDFNNLHIQKLGNKFHVIMDLLSEKMSILKLSNKLLAKFSTHPSATCYSGVLFIAKK